MTIAGVIASMHGIVVGVRHRLCRGLWSAFNVSGSYYFVYRNDSVRWRTLPDLDMQYAAGFSWSHIADLHTRLYQSILAQRYAGSA